jgi:hypothetical protein
MSRTKSALPGFTAGVALSGSKAYTKTLPFGSGTIRSLAPSNYYHYTGDKQQRNIPQTSNGLLLSSDIQTTWKVPESPRESSHTGRRAWRDLETACNNLQCNECRRDCISFVNGLHDAINIKLGKQMKTPNDFIYLRNFINAMSKNVLKF